MGKIIANTPETYTPKLSATPSEQLKARKLQNAARILSANGVPYSMSDHPIEPPKLIWNHVSIHALPDSNDYELRVPEHPVQGRHYVEKCGIVYIIDVAFSEEHPGKFAFYPSRQEAYFDGKAFGMRGADMQGVVAPADMLDNIKKALQDDFNSNFNALVTR